MPWPAATRPTPRSRGASRSPRPAADLSVSATEDGVVVRGTVSVDGIGGLFDALPSVRLTAEAVAAVEVPP